MNQALSALIAGAFLLAAGAILGLLPMINIGALIFLFGLGLLILEKHVQRRKRRRGVRRRWLIGDTIKALVWTGAVAWLGWLLFVSGGFGR